MFNYKHEELLVLSQGVDFPKCKTVLAMDFTINGASKRLLGIGLSKCNKADKFNKQFGLKLSLARAYIDLFSKFEECLIKQTKFPEWSKNRPDYIDELINNFDETLKYFDKYWRLYQ